MTIRRFNYTGLKKIDRKHARIILENNPDGTAMFRAELILADYKFPDNAHVFVEAYRQTTWMRFAWGTISSLVRPVDTILTDFDSPVGVKFRVRVTANGEHHGMMLGEADRICPVGEFEDDDERSPLLPVRTSEDLGDEVYKVDMDQSPTLLINRKVGDWRALAVSPVFQVLTAPAILRSVLVHLLVITEAYDPDDQESPHARWLRFAQSLPGVSEFQPGVSEPHSWIDDAVRAFSAQKTVIATFMKQWEKGGLT